MRVFACRQVREAKDHALAGGQALHLHTYVFPDSPRCFRDAVARGEPIAHLFDRDELRLVATVRRLGVKVVVVEHPGTDRQHVDLCAGPLRRALAEADNPAEAADIVAKIRGDRGDAAGG